MWRVCFSVCYSVRACSPWQLSVVSISARSIRFSMAFSGLRWSRCFFFQAEDGIRDTSVTGVQTCALPISGGPEAAATQLVQQYRAAGRAIPGYGHPLHKGYDPRARRLFEVSAEVGLAGQHVAIARTVEQLLPQLLGRPLALNVSGAIPAVLLDAGYPLAALKGVPLLARTAGLVAHLLEEQTRPLGFVMLHDAAEAIDYEGPEPPGFVPSGGVD